MPDAKVGVSVRSALPSLTTSALSVASVEATASRSRSVTSLVDDQSRPVLSHW